MDVYCALPECLLQVEMCGWRAVQKTFNITLSKAADVG
jgi:hypothetical protein